jgi:hypothetical protein
MNFRLVRAVVPALVAVPLLALLLGGAPALADDEDAGPAVARVSVIQGEVDVRRGDSEDVVAAAINAPLLAGDYLTTHAGARAEVQFDYGNALRAAADTELGFTRIDATNHAAQLALGTVELRVFDLTDARPEIDTPSAAVRPQATGRYRITVTDDGTTYVTVRAGRAEVVSPQSVHSVAAGSTVLVSGPGSDPAFDFVDTVARDDFERWNDERDRYAQSPGIDRYVDGGLVGAADLQQYGRWVDVAGYGNVWSPYATAGWAPYQSGRWVWEGYYGWTWVSDEPWGWAPYHYGRWFYNADYGWCWYPERARAHHIWRPALVAFFSFGGGGGLAVGFGNVGWVPLAPNEPFHPWFGNQRHLDNTTIVNTTTYITNINVYRNVRAPGAVNGVSRQDFSGGHFNRIVRVNPIEMRGATPVRGVLPVVPTAENLRLSDRPIVRRGGSTPVERHFARFTPPATRVRSFSDQRAEAQAEAQRRYPLHADEILHQSIVTPKPAAPAGVTNENLNGQYPPFRRSIVPATPSPTAHETPTWTRHETPVGTTHETPVGTTHEWGRFKNGGSGPPVQVIDGSAPDHARAVHTDSPPPVRRVPVFQPESVHTPVVHGESGRLDTPQPRRAHATPAPTDHPQNAATARPRRGGGRGEGADEPKH